MEQLWEFVVSQEVNVLEDVMWIEIFTMQNCEHLVSDSASSRSKMDAAVMIPVKDMI